MMSSVKAARLGQGFKMSAKMNGGKFWFNIDANAEVVIDDEPKNERLEEKYKELLMSLATAIAEVSNSKDVDGYRFLSYFITQMLVTGLKLLKESSNT